MGIGKVYKVKTVGDLLQSLTDIDGTVPFDSDVVTGDDWMSDFLIDIQINESGINLIFGDHNDKNIKLGECIKILESVDSSFLPYFKNEATISREELIEECHPESYGKITKVYHDMPKTFIE